MEFLSNIGVILFIVFFFGFCVFIHEFGHLLAAMWQKLHIEKFSIGFGPAIWGFTRNGIKYVISVLPLGGYVALPQLDPGETPKTEDGRPLEPGKPFARAVTAFAGPFFNILFGFFLATILWGVGVWRTPPASSCIVEKVPPVIPLYQDGLKETDRLISVNGKSYEGSLEKLCLDWPENQEKLDLPDVSALEPIHLTVKDKKGDIKELTYTPQISQEWLAGLRSKDRIVKVNGVQLTNGYSQLYELHAYNGLPQATVTVIRPGVPEPLDISYEQIPNPLFEGLGVPFYFARNPITLGGVLANSPAQKAGFKAGDQLLDMNGETITDTAQLLELLGKNTGKDASFTIARNGKEQTILLPIPAADAAQPSFHGLGFAFHVLINHVLRDSPAEAAGLQPKDRILKLNGLDITEVNTFTSMINNSKGAPVTLVIERHGQQMTLPPISAQEVSNKYLIGVQLDDMPQKIIVHLNPWTQFMDVFKQTTKTLSLLFRPLVSKVSHVPTSKSQVKIKHMSGFLGISAILWGTIQSDGFRGGFSFIILISFSLAFMNLLPLPVLDGGHIMFAAIEGLIRRRLPQKFLNWTQNAFAVLLIALMVYITFIDVLRLPKYFKVFSNDAPSMQKVEQDAATGDTKSNPGQPADPQPQP